MHVQVDPTGDTRQQEASQLAISAIKGSDNSPEEGPHKLQCKII